MASRPTRQHLDPLAVRRCESQKVGYRTHGEALTAAEWMMAHDFVKPGCHITPYVCQRCGQWHVGNRVIVPVSRRGN